MPSSGTSSYEPGPTSGSSRASLRSSGSPSYCSSAVVPQSAPTAGASRFGATGCSGSGTGPGSSGSPGTSVSAYAGTPEPSRSAPGSRVPPVSVGSTESTSSSPLS